MSRPPSPTDQDILDLDAFIRSRRLGPGVFKSHGIDGLVTAIVIGPDMVMPSRWMPRIWSDQEPKFRDLSEGQRIIGLIMGLYDRVAQSFGDDTAGQFEPLYARLDEGPARRKAIGQWCEGFIAGVAKHATWVEQRNRDATLEMIWPMIAVKDGGTLATPEVIEQIVPNVRRLHAHWLTHRRAAMPGGAPGARGAGSGPGAGVAPAPTVGRNDPCPCGSGLKFKKCCGGPGGTVH